MGNTNSAVSQHPCPPMQVATNEQNSWGRRGGTLPFSHHGPEVKKCICFPKYRPSPIYSHVSKAVGEDGSSSSSRPFSQANSRRQGNRFLAISLVNLRYRRINSNLLLLYPPKYFRVHGLWEKDLSLKIWTRHSIVRVRRDGERAEKHY